METVLDSLVGALVGGVVTGAAAWSAIRVELRYLRRDVDHLFNLFREMDRRMREEG